MTRVLFVCLGNICRSPLAEGVFRSLLENKGLDNQILVDSCGTSNYHIGEQPDPRTLKNARRNNIQLDHCARQFSTSDFENFDYIVVMDRSNLENVLKLDPQQKYRDKVMLLRDFDPVDRGGEVPDPYHGGEQGFQNVYDIVQRSSEGLLERIREDQEV